VSESLCGAKESKKNDIFLYGNQFKKKKQDSFYHG
jgi:hypothetical protein